MVLASPSAHLLRGEKFLGRKDVARLVLIYLPIAAAREAYKREIVGKGALGEEQPR